MIFIFVIEIFNCESEMSFALFKLFIGMIDFILQIS